MKFKIHKQQQKTTKLKSPKIEKKEYWEMQCLFVCVQGFRVAVVAAADGCGDDDIDVDPYKLLMMHTKMMMRRANMKIWHLYGWKFFFFFAFAHHPLPLACDFTQKWWWWWWWCALCECVGWCVCACVREPARLSTSFPKKKKKSKQKSSDRKSKIFPVPFCVCPRASFTTHPHARLCFYERFR